jgi:hypothetical protein
VLTIGVEVGWARAAMVVRLSNGERAEGLSTLLSSKVSWRLLETLACGTGLKGYWSDGVMEW